MDTLYLRNLKFWGSHGVLETEREVRQPFGVDIKLQYDFAKSIETDFLADTIDYKTIEAIVERIITGPPLQLIETLAGAIAETILTVTDSEAVEVAVSKLRASSTGIPIAVVRRTKTAHQKKDSVQLLDITREKVRDFYAPHTDGIIHIKNALYTILNKEQLLEWYEKKWPTFEKKEEKYIQNSQEVGVAYHGVFESLSRITDQQEIALHMLFHKIREGIKQYSTVPFESGDLLEVKSMKYAVSNLGIGAHKDMSSDRNVIVVLNLYGTTTFYTATDKNRSNEKAYLIEPGDIVIMRAPRNMSKAERALRPIHYILDIAEPRAALIFREIDTVAAAIVNKDNWRGF